MILMEDSQMSRALSYSLKLHNHVYIELSELIFPHEMQTSIIFVLKGFLCKTVVVTVVIVTATTD